jgi:hypothetical protein
MHSAAGAAALAAGAALVVAVLVLRRRLPAAASTAVLAAAGACLGAGALLMESRDVNAINWIVTLALAASGTPAHVVVVTGPPRRGARA